MQDVTPLAVPTIPVSRDQMLGCYFFRCQGLRYAFPKICTSELGCYFGSSPLALTMDDRTWAGPRFAVKQKINTGFGEGYGLQCRGYAGKQNSICKGNALAEARIYSAARRRRQEIKNVDP
jgi:hypothetical protein